MSHQAGKETEDIGALQRAEDFVKAFILGFEVDVSRDIFTKSYLCSSEI